MQQMGMLEASNQSLIGAAQPYLPQQPQKI
jgi:hypothetical protein